MNQYILYIRGNQFFSTDPDFAFGGYVNAGGEYANSNLTSMKTSDTTLSALSLKSRV